MSDPQTPQTDPLAALEELLKNSPSGGGDAALAEPSPEKQAEQQQAEDAQKQQMVADMEEKQKEKDAEALKAQIANIQNIGETPQEQARVSQKENEQGVQQQQASANDGFEIRQLGHKKI